MSAQTVRMRPRTLLGAVQLGHGGAERASRRRDHQSANNDCLGRPHWRGRASGRCVHVGHHGLIYRSSVVLAGPRVPRPGACLHSPRVPLELQLQVRDAEVCRDQDGM